MALRRPPPDPEGVTLLRVPLSVLLLTRHCGVCMPLWGGDTDQRLYVLPRFVP